MHPFRSFPEGVRLPGSGQRRSCHWINFFARTTAIVALGARVGLSRNLLGLILGDMVYLTAVVLGLAFVAQTFATAFLLVKIAGALYLGYIAWKLWTAGL